MQAERFVHVLNQRRPNWLTLRNLEAALLESTHAWFLIHMQPRFADNDQLALWFYDNGFRFRKSDGSLKTKMVPRVFFDMMRIKKWELEKSRLTDGLYLVPPKRPPVKRKWVYKTNSMVV